MAPFYSVASIFCFLLLQVSATENSTLSPEDAGATTSQTKAVFQKAILSSMRLPESTARLIEVMPLLRSLTRAQRHVLAQMLRDASLAPASLKQEAVANASLARLLPQLDVVSLLQRGQNESQREANEQARQRALDAIAALPEPRNLDTTSEANDTTTIDELPEALKAIMTPEEFLDLLARHKALVATRVHKKRVPPRAPSGSAPPVGPPPRGVSIGLRPPPPPKSDECDLFANNLCLNVPNYPKEAIVSSMKRSTSSVLGVLAREIETEPTSERRQDVEENLVGVDNENGVAGASLCPSITKYARPKRARNTNGQWKFLVNTGEEHSQTLRIELCTEPGESCNYLANGVASQCVQVFTHHRLLAWDHERGLYLDIFKVPTCCSCHIQPAYGPAVFPATAATSPRPTRAPQPPPLEAEPEYVEVADETAGSSMIHETRHTMRPSLVPMMEWPTKRPLLPTPVAATERPQLVRRPSMPTLGKPTFQVPAKAGAPPPVHETPPHQSNFNKDGRKRPSLRPRDKIRSDLEEAGAIATHRRRRPPSVPSSPPSDRVRSSSDELDEHSRINYSYHPIIDFFRNEERHKQWLSNHHVADRRAGGAGPVTYVGDAAVAAADEWRPIEPSHRVPQKRF